MTMRLKIENTDTNRTAVVETVDVNHETHAETVAQTIEIAPSASGEVWIHQGRFVRVSEKQA